MKQNNQTYTYIMYYRRSGVMAWIAHLDTMKIFERSFRRANLPLAWSQGYNPRPNIVFALPIGVGFECLNDMLVVELETKLILDDDLPKRISSYMPENLDVHRIEESPVKRKSIMSLVDSAQYRIEGEGLGKGFAELTEREEPVIVERIHKGKNRQIDIFSHIREQHIHDDSTFDFICDAGSSNNLRADLVLKAIGDFNPELSETCRDARIIRENLFLALE